MKSLFLATAAAVAIVMPVAPLSAQHQHMPGMSMPMPPQPKTAPKKPASRKVVRKVAATKNAATAKQQKKSPTAKSKPAKAATAKSVMDHGTMPASADVVPVEQGVMPMDHAMPMDHGAMTMPASPMAGAGSADHAQMNHGAMDHSAMSAGTHQMAMTSALGAYPMERESSGTAWQPDASEHAGLMVMRGDWTLMAHGTLHLVADHQGGPRGEDKLFASGMLMAMARRPLGDGTLQFRAALSPDPLVGKNGYPLLLASGETANGRDRLIDRQHPHDFFMELSASVSQNIGPRSSVFLYGGLPGEPAFGPPAFMHREAIMDSPEAPISHHWLDSTHISFGVLTAGVVMDRVKVEVSRFNAREPDQHRWNIETGPLDSTAVRLSLNPTPELALQGSWGYFVDPEQLEPGVNQRRWSASLLYARDMAPGWKLAGTLAWGRKTVDHHNDDAFVAEASVKLAGWTVFGRGEITENRELLDTEDHGPAYRVGKISVGAVRDFRISENVAFGVGALAALNFVPNGLAPLYGGKNPTGAMGFVRLKLDGGHE